MHSCTKLLKWYVREKNKNEFFFTKSHLNRIAREKFNQTKKKKKKIVVDQIPLAQ